ncbi:MAG: DUF2723 domain-containing protein, partial [Pseudomonadales bacterium]|nr:DUF2723 domain-containing protein [Pseudomonadales bacterium]
MTRRFLHPIAAMLIVLVVYWAAMPTTITLEDAGLFQMVCHLGGIAHPPGYPLFTMVCGALLHDHGVTGGNLLSAISGALAVAICHVACFELTRERIFAYVASLGWGLSATFFSQAIIIEVYAPAALLFAVCLWLLVRFRQEDDDRYWFALCFAFGLSLSNHWPLMLLAAPGLAVLATPALPGLLRRARRVWFLPASV